ncbi:MAG: hypothetical protein IPO27_09710 [Bacteroidetes bacterium]|nr:hypothetical protein [Bacteroidota bacterium]
MLLTIVCEASIAQIEWRLLGNSTVGASDYVGCQGLANLNFRTNANPRMRIFNGAGGLTGNGPTTDGFVGIGDFDFFTASNLLHQHLNFKRSNFHQFTNDNTGVTATDGSLFGIEYRTATNSGVNYSIAQ